jgi:hypothetical protein
VLLKAAWCGDARLRVAQFLANLWQGALRVPPSAPKSGRSLVAVASGSGHGHHLAGALESRCQRRHPDHGHSQGQGGDANDPGENLSVHPEFLGQDHGGQQQPRHQAPW